METAESKSQSRQVQVVRQHLLDRLIHLDQYALVLIQAPAGFGKTTLIKQLSQAHLNCQLIEVYLMSRDRDPVRFFRKLAEKLCAKVKGLDFTALHPFNDQDVLQPEAMAYAIIDAVAHVEQKLVLVLDDFQYVESQLINETLNIILAQEYTPLIFLVASRKRPGLALSTLKLDAKLLLLESHDLALNPDEITELNYRLGLRDIAVEDVSQLMHITEGWMAGVKIALLAANQNGVDAVRLFNGLQPDVVDYFGQVVLKTLPDSLYQFFLKSAVFERFNGALCDEVLQTTQSSERLEKLMQGEFFIFREENAPGWYRYHSLMRDFLLARLKVDHAEIIPSLHRRAAKFFLALNELEAALQHAEKSQDQVFYLETLVQCFDIWTREGHFEHVRHCLATIDTNLIADNFALMARLICALTFSRYFNQAEFYLNLLEEQYSNLLSSEEKSTGTAVSSGKGSHVQRLETKLPIDEDQLAILQTLTFLRLLLQLFENETDFMAGDNLESLMTFGQHRDLRAFSLAMAAYYHQQHAQLHEALTLAGRAREVLNAMKENFIANYAGLIQVLCKRQLGLLGDAIKDVQAEFEKVEVSSPSWVLWGTGMVVVRYDQNQLNQARQLCESLLPRINSTSATEVIATVYLTMSRLHFHNNEKIKARRLLEKLMVIIKLGRYERFISRTGFEMLRQAVLNENKSDIETIAQSLGIPSWIDEYGQCAPPQYSESWEYKGLAAGWYLVFVQRQSQAIRVFKVLRDALLAFGIKNRVVVYDANITVLRCKTEDRQVRASHLRGLLERYGILTLNRSVLDEVPGLDSLLKMAANEKLIEVDDRFRAMFREIFDASISSSPTERKDILPIESAGELLTNKEMDMLNGILRGLSNAEIAQQSGTSVATVKWHLRNIYAKLQVSNRTEAILRVNPRANILR
ncbi:Serine/threonine-protein kinase PknK [Thalassocella blandensis]|nr:Serine/threonine-protein kinase PknK [Thalassocella blandensis]